MIRSQTSVLDLIDIHDTVAYIWQEVSLCQMLMANDRGR